MALLMFVTYIRHAAGRRLLLALGLATCCLCLPVDGWSQASGYQLQTEIRQAVEQFVRSQFPKSVEISTLVGKLDPHLRLAACPQPLEAFYPAGARKLGPTTIGVRCHSTSPWRIFISVQIRAYGPAVISKHPLSRGSIVQPDDLTIGKRELSGALQGYFTSLESVVGMELRYSLASGRIISPQVLKPRHLVRRGDIVTILAERKGLLIRVKGKALMNGTRGQSIRVKNTRSDRILQGEVVASRTVRIKL